MLRKIRPLRRSFIAILILSAVIITGCGVSVANTNWPGLSAGGDMAYVAFGSTVMAVDIENEELAWSFPDEPKPTQQFYAAPSIVENEIVVGDYGQTGGMLSPGIKVSVYALEQDEGQNPSINWTTADSLIKDKIIAPPLQVGDQVFIGTADNKVLALDAANGGTLEWEFETGHSIWGQPTYEEGILYVSSLDRSLYALDANSGDLLWQSETGGSISDSAMLNGELVYISGFDHKIHAVEKKTGDIRWSVETEAAVWGSPAFEDGLVFFVDLNGNLQAVDGETGQEIWREALNSYTTAAPIVRDGVLFVATAGDLGVEQASRGGRIDARLAKSGEKLWTESTNAPIYSTPVFVNDNLVVAYLDQEQLALAVYNPADGDDIWLYRPTSGSS